MAGFAVVVHRGGAAVPAAVVEPIAASLSHRAPDGTDVSTVGAVAAVVGRLHATPEAHLERQPVEGPSGARLVADVRLDNRRELMELLGWTRPAAATTDPDLIAACYTRFGRDTPDVLVGDFAAVVIEADGRILAVRDHLGVKPLYYWISRDWIMLSSELRQIAAHPDAPRDVDAGMCGQYLSGHVESRTGTVVAGVHRLPGGHRLTIGRDGTRVDAYWRPSFDERLELGTRAEYEDAFMDLFTEAVRCRMRTAGPTAAELSGGLDSTSVTAVAAGLVASGGVPSTEVHALSCLFPWSRRADEYPYIRQAVEALGVPWTGVVDDARRRRWAFTDAAFWSDIPLPPDGPDHVELCHTARRQGCAVVLTGHGGDHAFDPSPFVLPELLEERRFLEAWRLSTWFAGPRVRPRLAALVGAARPDSRPPGAGPRAAPVTGTARSRSGLDDRPVAGQLHRAYRRRRAQAHYERFCGGYDAMSLEVFDRIAARAGVEYRHPYLDRRLVEFGCRVPVWVHATSTANRCLQRGALRDTLPHDIVRRRSKASFSEVWLRDLESHLPHRDWPRSALVTQGWIDAARADVALARTRRRVAGPNGAGPIFMLWGMVQIEAVLRALRAGDQDGSPG
jgi:asparagine synthase (glutamine-hydrolysing)